MKEYICSSCGSKNLKLWRDPHNRKAITKCASCLGHNNVGKDGKREGTNTDKLGSWIPAIPILGEEGGFWGYLSIPEDQAKWWQNLRVYDQ